MSILKEYLIPADAADYIGLKISTLRKWRSLKQGPVFIKQAGNRILYKKSDLDDYLNSCRQLTKQEKRVAKLKKQTKPGFDALAAFEKGEL